MVDENVSFRGVLFNCAWTVVYQAATVAAGVSVGSFVSAFVSHAPFQGFISAAIARAGFLPVALTIGAGTAIVSDFFYY